MGYCLNRLDEPVLIAVSKPLLTEFGIHHRLESCDFVPCKVLRMSPYVRLGTYVKMGTRTYRTLASKVRRYVISNKLDEVSSWDFGLFLCKKKMTRHATQPCH